MIPYTTRDAARVADIPLSTLYGWLRSGAIKGATKEAGRWIIPSAGLLRRKGWNFIVRQARKARANTAPAARPVPGAAWDTDHPEIALLNRALRAGVTPAAIADAVGTRSLASGRPFSRRDTGRVLTLIGDAQHRAAKRTGCRYCGQPITRHDGECQDCGSQAAVAHILGA